MTVLERPTFYLLRPDEIDQVWELVVPGIARALATSDGEATVEDTKAGLLAGTTQMMLFGGESSWFGVVFQMLAFPQAKIARVLLAFGKNMAEQRQAMESAEAWAKGQGCKWVEAWVATESRVRMFGRYGYKPRYAILRKELP